MKWYTCLNFSGLAGLGESLLAAVHSCLANTTLEPHVIFDGPPNAVTDHLEKSGAFVHHHTLSFASQIMATDTSFGLNKDVAMGAYLRLDIPLIECNDDFVLYTDADVVFLSDPKLEVRPEIFAAAPELAPVGDGYVPYAAVFNSGVMVLNVEGYRREVHGLVSLARQHGFFPDKAYDQGAANEFFAERWEPLPQTLNWRPFGKLPGEPTILHFHGIKPYDIASLRAGIPAINPSAEAFFTLAREDYLAAFDQYAQHVTSDGLAALRSVCPTAQITVDR